MIGLVSQIIRRQAAFLLHCSGFQRMQWAIETIESSQLNNLSYSKFTANKIEKAALML